MNRVRKCLIVLLTSAGVVLASAGTASADLLYGADGAGGNAATNLYIVNSSNGQVLKTVGPIGFAVTGLAIDPTTGTLYGSTAQRNTAPNPGSLITINRTTGAGTLVGDARPDNESVADITFTPDGTLYGWLEDNTDDLVTLNKATGAATVVGDSGLSTYGSGIASNASGTLYFAGEGEQGQLFTVDRNTGAATPVATLNGPDGDPGISALAFDSVGTLFGSRLPSNSTVNGFGSDLLTINIGSGAITSLGKSVDRLDAIAFVPPRTVTLKKKLKNGGEKVVLSGRISDATDPACVAVQPVKIQRKPLGSAKAAKKKRKFKTFKKVTTKQNGSFSTKAKVTRSFKYRAFLPESNVCDDSTSKAKKVKA